MLGANGIEVTREPVASNAAEIIPYKFITNITPIFRQKSENYFSWMYRFDVMTVIAIQIKFGKKGLKFEFELQEVTNQSGWSTGTLAGLNQAIQDINNSTSPSGGFLLQEDGGYILQENGGKIII